MIRINKEKLAAATESAMACARSATDGRGLPIVWEPDSALMERAICLALASLAPGKHTECVIPSDYILYRVNPEGSDAPLPKTG